MDPKLSIIVPIYNVEKYLPRCIDSILAQTYTDFELILVDDGSPDNCPQICDEYALKDQRIIVIHQINGGVSDARNTALKISRGKYVAFVDGDDFIIPDAYVQMIKEMDTYELDILTGRCCRLLDGNIKKVSRKPRTFENIVYPGIDFFCLSLQQDVMSTGCWLNMYNLAFLLDNDLLFKKGIIHEDELWVPQVFCKAQRVKYIDLVFYSYVMRPNSITTAIDKTRNGIDLLNVCYELEPLYARVGNKTQREILNVFLFNTYLRAVSMGRLYRPEYRHLIRREFIFGKPSTAKNKAKALLFLLSPQLYVKVAELKA